MDRYFIHKHYPALAMVLLLVSCQTIPEWDKETIDNPIEDGRCPDLSGRFNYEHLGAKDTSEFDSILGNDLPDNLPADRAVPADYKPCSQRGAQLIPIPPPAPGDFDAGHYASAAIYNKIHKGKFDPYPGINHRHAGTLRPDRAEIPRQGRLGLGRIAGGIRFQIR